MPFPFRVFSSLAFGLFAALPTYLAIAAEQPNNAEILSEQLTKRNLDYYLVQAFHATTADQRIALNHIGIQGRADSQGFIITSVLESYPAHQAGLMRGDIIVTANGEPFDPVASFNPEIAGMKVFQASSSVYDLRVNRRGDTINVSLTPVFENLYDSFRSANTASVQQFSAGNKVIGYLHLWALSRSSNDLINTKRLLAELDQCDGIILDLRDSFGFLDPEHLRLVLPTNTTINIERAEGRLQTINTSIANLTGEAYRRPVAVLINAGTRGGPELLALELSKLERIISMGSPTPGRIGSYWLDPDTDNIGYQPAAFTLIDGKLVEGVGVEPEVSIPFPITETRRNDLQFDTAFDFLLGVI